MRLLAKAVNKKGSPHKPMSLEGAFLREVLGRGDWIRTSDPLLPKQMRYQTALLPDCAAGLAAKAQVQR